MAAQALTQLSLAAQTASGDMVATVGAVSTCFRTIEGWGQVQWVEFLYADIEADWCFPSRSNYEAARPILTALRAGVVNLNAAVNASRAPAKEGYTFANDMGILCRMLSQQEEGVRDFIQTMRVKARTGARAAERTSSLFRASRVEITRVCIISWISGQINSFVRSQILFLRP